MASQFYDWEVQSRVAIKYGYHGPFDPQLLEDLGNDYRGLFLAESILHDTDEMAILKKYPEVWRNLVDILGTAICRANGAKVDHILEQKEPDKRIIKDTFVMKDGTIVHVI